MLCCVTFHPLLELTNSPLVGTAFSPTLTVGTPAIGPRVSQALFSPGHQHRSTEVSSQDCSNHASGTTVGAVEATQTLAWPISHLYLPRKSTAAKARPVSAAGTLVVPSDVPEVLSLQSQSWGCNSVVHTVGGEISALLSCMAPGALLWFQPHLCTWATHRHLLPGLPWSTQSPPRWEGAEAATRGA